MKDVRHEVLKVRLDVNNAQGGLFMGYAGASRVAYNFAVEKLQANQREYARMRDEGVDKVKLPKPLTAIDLQNLWFKERGERAPWHKQYSTRVYLFAFRAAQAALRNWMGGWAKFPKFKSRKDRRSFRVCDSLRLEPGRLHLPRMGWVRVSGRDSRQADLRRLIRRGRARLTSVAISQDATGAWWASLAVERKITHQGAPVEPSVAVGVDVGVKTLAIAAKADGEVILDTGQTVIDQRLELALVKAQRSVSRKDRVYSKANKLEHHKKSPSGRRVKSQRRVAKLHQKTKRRRENKLHVLTRNLTDLKVAVVVENLNVKGMTRKGGSRKKGLNRAIQAASFGELRRQLSYKLPEGFLVVADRFYPSSKRCSSCGVENQDLTLAMRVWECVCGVRHDRDVNAATNLAIWGEQHLIDTGTQIGDRQGVGPSAISKPAEGVEPPSIIGCPSSVKLPQREPGVPKTGQLRPGISGQETIPLNNSNSGMPDR